MPRPWRVFESLDGPAALPVVWRAFLGDEFGAFRAAFLRDMDITVGAYFCFECNDNHEIVRHEDGSIVALCQGESSICGTIPLKPEDCVAIELNWEKLGRAICKAFGFQGRHADLGVHNAVQIGVHTDRVIPVVLGIHCERAPFRHALCELAARLRRQFILIAPTADWMDAPCQEILSGVQAKFLALETSVVLTPQGALRAMRPPEQLIGIAPEPGQPAPEDVALQAFRIVEKLDSERPMKPPTLLAVFRLYCMKSMTTEQIARECRCSKGTVINRLKSLGTRLGLDLDQLRQYSPQFGKIESDIAQSKGSYVHRKSLISDDSGHGREF